MGNKESIIFHSGNYCFRWPFFAWGSVPDENNSITTYYCDVKIIIGDERDLCEGKIVTVVIYPLRNQLGTSSYYATIASGIRNGVIRNVFHEYTMREDPLSENNIRWIEAYTDEYIKGILPCEEYREVSMKWDNKARAYSGSVSKLVEFEERYKKND